MILFIHKRNSENLNPFPFECACGKGFKLFDGFIKLFLFIDLFLLTTFKITASGERVLAKSILISLEKKNYFFPFYKFIVESLTKIASMVLIIFSVAKIRIVCGNVLCCKRHFSLL